MKKFGLITFMLIQHFGFSQILNYNFTSAASTFANNTSPTTIHGSLVDDVLSPAINIGLILSTTVKHTPSLRLQVMAG